mmetsp:Transcript_30967/g.67992  ORF Transcript_30967/g.67992 Transcript_30967/m.67992 type:complete len:119 (+) Transcript_30967:70-426(+)
MAARLFAGAKRIPGRSGLTQFAQRRAFSEFAQTSGSYGNLPKPVPTSHFFWQPSWPLYWKVFALSGCFFSQLFGIYGPWYVLPVWLPSKQRAADATADAEFGPRRYGAGVKLSSGGGW